MMLLRLLTWPYVRKHRLRSLLTLSGIVLGVAVFVGMHTANQSVKGAFARTVDKIAGKAQIQISAGEAGFPEEALETVQQVDGITAAAPVIEGILETQGKQGNLLLLGVDMTGDRSLREYDLDGGEDEEVIDDPLIFLAQPDSLILSHDFAARNGIARGSKISLNTMAGPREFTVRGIMKTEGLASAFGGNVAVMDIYAAQAVFGRGRSFDRIDIGLADGVSIDDAVRRLRAALGPGYDVGPPASRSQQFESISRGLSISINITSLFALLIGVFIIYNSFSIAITQRRSEIGILRALGATERQVLRMFVAEAAMAGVIGSALGILAGLAMGRAISPALSYLVREVYGKPQSVDELSLEWPLLLGAMAIGVAASLVGGFLPARAAASIDPVKALQKGQYQVLSSGQNRYRRIGAAILAAGALYLLITERADLWFYAGYAMAVGAVTLLSPSFAMWLARALRPVLKAIHPVEGALAADSLIQAPRRTSATVSALMLSLALAVGFSGMSAGIYRQVLAWMDNTLNPDLFVAPTQSVTQRSFRFPASMKTELEAMPIVEEVQAVRDARIMLGDAPAKLVSVDIDHIQRRVGITPVEGEPRQMLAETKAGRGVLISEGLSNIRNLHLGDSITLNSPSGPVELKIAGVLVDYSDQQGSMLIDRDVFVRHWKDDTATLFRVYLKSGTDAEQARRDIVARFSAHRTLFVFTNSEIRKLILDTTAQWFGMTYLQLAVALLVAIMGIVNTLTVSITDRRRELGILQAVGGLRQQVRATIWLEALAIGAIGLILGLLMGALTLYYNLVMVRGDLAGLRLDYIYPVGFAVFLTPVIIGVAWLASLWPAETAVRTSLVEALEYE